MNASLLPSKKSIDEIRTDFLVITALPEERDAVLQYFKLEETITIDESFVGFLCYVETQLGSINVIVTTLSSMGNVEAGIHTSRVIEVLKPSFVVMVGIAGGIKGRVRKGDVLVAQQLIYYSQGKQSAVGMQIRPHAISVNPFLLQIAQTISGNEWRRCIKVEQPTEGGQETTEPSIHFGPLAVGESVVADERHVNTLIGLHPKMVGVEMESFGVGRAILHSSSQPKFIVFRGVSDYADSEKDDSWHEYACQAVAAFTFAFVKSGFLWNGPTPRENKSNNRIAVMHLSQQRIAKTTMYDSMQLHYPDASTTEILLDEMNSFKRGVPKDIDGLVRRQARIFSRINKAIANDADITINYFGLAHIPLLFHLGFKLTNKRQLRFFEWDRYSGGWNPLQERGTYDLLQIENLPNHTIDLVGDVILRISISNSIELADVLPVVPESISSIHLASTIRKRDLVTTQQQVWDYGKQFRQVLDAVHELMPNRRTLHVFYAGPASLAVYLGQLIHPGVDRNVFVYNYTPAHTPRYSWGLEITQ
jgi:nucleoside phosphorylase